MILLNPNGLVIMNPSCQKESPWHSGIVPNIADTWKMGGPGLSRCISYKVGIFQPAMLVYQRVLANLGIIQKVFVFFWNHEEGNF